MSTWIFNAYTDGVVRDASARVNDVGLALVGENGRLWMRS